MVWEEGPEDLCARGGDGMQSSSALVMLAAAVIVIAPLLEGGWVTCVSPSDDLLVDTGLIVGVASLLSVLINTDSGMTDIPLWTSESIKSLVAFLFFRFLWPFSAALR